jgi:phage shock protein C
MPKKQTRYRNTSTKHSAKKVGVQFDFGNLSRSSSNAILGGVCGGLANFFNVDVSVIRLIFALLVVFGGSGILLYIILWVVLPSDKSTPGITEENIKMNAEEIKNKATELSERFKSGSKHENSRIIVGVVLLLLGISFLFSNFGLFNFHWVEKLWPLILIFIAFSILTNDRRRR